MKAYLFVCESDEHEAAEYAIGNQMTYLFVADNKEAAIAKFRHETENRDECEFGEPPTNPYRAEYTSSIDRVKVYEVLDETFLPVSKWAIEIEQERVDLESQRLREKEEQEFIRLKEKLGR